MTICRTLNTPRWIMIWTKIYSKHPDGHEVVIIPLWACTNTSSRSRTGWRARLSSWWCGERFAAFWKVHITKLGNRTKITQDLLVFSFEFPTSGNQKRWRRNGRGGSKLQKWVTWYVVFKFISNVSVRGVSPEFAQISNWNIWFACQVTFWSFLMSKKYFCAIILHPWTYDMTSQY